MFLDVCKLFIIILIYVIDFNVIFIKLSISAVLEKYIEYEVRILVEDVWEILK